MDQPLPFVAGHVVNATRQEKGRLRVRPFMVGIPDREEAAGAIISAYPELDDGFQVEATITITQENADSLDLAPGEIRECAEESLS